jgi:hypothetical protein
VSFSWVSSVQNLSVLTPETGIGAGNHRRNAGFWYIIAVRKIPRKGLMPKAQTPTSKTPIGKTPISKTPAKKPAAKPAPTEAAATKPASAAEPVAEAKPAAAKPAKAPPHPKPEQPMWARMNQGHSQKMSKGRPFRHQGR